MSSARCSRYRWAAAQPTAVRAGFLDDNVRLRSVESARRQPLPDLVTYDGIARGSPRPRSRIYPVEPATFFACSQGEWPIVVASPGEMGTMTRTCGIVPGMFRLVVCLLGPNSSLRIGQRDDACPSRRFNGWRLDELFGRRRLNSYRPEVWLVGIQNHFLGPRTLGSDPDDRPFSQPGTIMNRRRWLRQTPCNQ